MSDKLSLPVQVIAVTIGTVVGGLIGGVIGVTVARFIHLTFFPWI